jgi:thiamine biosynthesis protein ThiI
MRFDHIDRYVVRLSGTLSRKAPKTRRRFYGRLEDNLCDGLDRAGIDYHLENRWSRMHVVSDDPEAGDVLSSICGIRGIRPSIREPWDSLEDVVRRGVELYDEAVEGRTFAVDARRVGPREDFPFDSVDVNETLGAELVDAGGDVDLDDPEVEVNLEIDRDAAYFFDREIEGPAGLPIGVEGRALSLVSGGVDSIVASWLMLKRGVELDLLFFNLGGPPHERNARRVLARMADRWMAGSEPVLHTVDFRPAVAEIKAHASNSYWQLLLKRLMMRAADKIACRGDYPALVTGEAIGQVSTQTLGNLAAIEGPIETPILRPLIGSNKEDIIDRARSIGMHEATEQIPEFCHLDSDHTVTNSNVDRLDREEDELDLEMLEAIVEDREMPSARAYDPSDEVPDIQIDEVPEEAEVIDLRAESEYERWHYPDAVHVPFETAREQYRLLPSEPTWLLYCDVGLKSALIAEKMQKAGFDAYSFRGGVPRLEDHV